VKVLLVGHRFPPDGIAGVERVIQSVARELRGSGDDVAILCHRPKSDERLTVLRERLRDGTRLFRMVGGAFSLDQFTLEPGDMDQRMTEVLVEVDPDVVHIHHLIGMSPAFPEIVRRHRIPLVISLHDFYFACPLAHLVTTDGKDCDGPQGGDACATTCFPVPGVDTGVKWKARASRFLEILQMANIVICPSQFVADYFIAFGVSRSRIEVLSNGVDLGRHGQRSNRPSASAGRETMRLAFVGSVVEHKGVHTIVEAIELAGIDRVELLVLGKIADHRYAASLREKVSRLPGCSLHFHGAYTPHALPDLLQDIDCVVCPSQVRESYALTVHEALSCGVPALVARHSALREAIQNGRNGLYFAPRSSESLAKCLKELSVKPDLLSHLKRGARGTAIVDSHTHAIRLRSAYETLVWREVISRGDVGDRDRSRGSRHPKRVHANT
jgi:glycosyltransferase involved in cell wall biosynthesis